MKYFLLGVLTVVMLNLGMEAYADEENGHEGLAFCMQIGAIAGDVQRARLETKDTMEEMMGKVVKTNPNGSNLGQVLAVIGGVYNDIDITMPPRMVSDVVLGKCLEASKIEILIEPEEEVEIEYSL